jgi:hypothetical protein
LGPIHVLENTDGESPGIDIDHGRVMYHADRVRGAEP